VNTFQATVMQTTGWVLVLLDGWAMHTHWLAAIGFIFLIYSMWSICMKTPEDKEFDAMDGDHDHKYIKHQLHPMPPTRNEVLEEVAKEFDKMRSLGDTAASFAAYVRGMKQ
jgi:hypothetical protein